MKITKEIIVKIVALYGRGKSLRRLSEITGLSHETIRKMIPEDILRKKRNISRKRILELYNKYKSYTDAARKLDVTPQYVYTIVKEAREDKKENKCQTKPKKRRLWRHPIKK